MVVAKSLLFFREQRIGKSFKSLIYFLICCNPQRTAINYSNHRKSGNLTAGVGRQYIGEIGKTYNGIVVVTTHLYDGVKRLPLDIEIRKKLILYQKEKNHNLSGNRTSAMSLKVY